MNVPPDVRRVGVFCCEPHSFCGRDEDVADFPSFAGDRNEALEHLRRDCRTIEYLQPHSNHESLPFVRLDRDIGTLVQVGFAYHELCDFSQALSIYKKVSETLQLVPRHATCCSEMHTKPSRKDNTSKICGIL